MASYYLILISGWILLTGLALCALRWALRTGQLKHPAKTALQIFDEGEPVGKMTDFFPGTRSSDGRNGKDRSPP